MTARSDYWSDPIPRVLTGEIYRLMEIAQRAEQAKRTGKYERRLRAEGRLAVASSLIPALKAIKKRLEEASE